jgi:LysM repeat protein
MPPLPGALDAPPAPLMKKKRSWLARFLALVALIVAIVAIIVVAKNTNLNSDSGKKSHSTKTHKQQQAKKKKPRTTKKTYTVQSGDTLTSISQKTGIPVAELQALNPEIDPQILVEGETLKLQK